MPRVIVVGAGVVGASVGLRLAQAGAQVTIVEAARPASGASMTSFAWLNSANKKPREYFDLNVMGMQAHRATAAEFGDASWLHGYGRLEWFDPASAPASERAIARLQDWGYGGGWIEPEHAFALEPDLNRAALEGTRPALFAHEGWIDPALYVAAMLRAAEASGATLRLGQAVSGLSQRGSQVTGVRLEKETIEGDIVVNCAGAAVNVVAAGLHRLPMATTDGLLAFTPPLPVLVRHIVAARGLSFRPDGAGRLMVHSGAADTELAAGDDRAAVARTVEEVLRALLPAAGAFELEAVRVTRRPIPGDGYPVVGSLPGVSGYYVVVSHSAVTLAPWLGRAVAEEVLGERQVPELAAYRPDRPTLAAVRPAADGG